MMVQVYQTLLPPQLNIQSRPLLVKWSYNPHKWRYKCLIIEWATGVITLNQSCGILVCKPHGCVIHQLPGTLLVATEWFCCATGRGIGDSWCKMEEENLYSPSIHVFSAIYKGFLDYNPHKWPFKWVAGVNKPDL